MDEETQKKIDEAEALVKEADEKTKDAEDALEIEKEKWEEERLANEKIIAEKDAVIEQKKNDVIGARKKYQKLSEMSDEDKNALTEKEFELQQRQEEQDERQVNFEKNQLEIVQKESKARKIEAIAILAGEDSELSEKIISNYDRIVGSDKASTVEEINSIVSDAFNMLGTPKKEAVEGVIADGGSGSAGDIKKVVDFSDTDKGKNVAESLGLTQSVEKSKDK